jgi:Tfp pilus assembly protein PilF
MPGADSINYSAKITRLFEEKLRKCAMRTTLPLAARRISIVLAVSLTLGLTAGCHRDPNKEKLRYLESGKRYADQGKLKEATIQFANALKVDRNYADAHYQLSKVFLKEGSIMPAYGELMRTVDLQPGNLQARIDLGNILLAGKQIDRATAQATAVLAIDNNNADAHALLSSIAAAKGDRIEALAQIQQALAADPNRAAFHASLGLLQSNDPATAAAGEDQLRKAVSLDGKNVTARVVLASLLQKKGDLQGAEEQMKAAVAADPKSVMARASLADLYMHQKDTAKAEQTLHRASEDLSDSESGAGMLATYYIRTNQLAAGETAYADLVAKHPKSAPLKIAYLRLLILNKDLPKARTVGTELAKNESNIPEVAVLNGMLQLNDGKAADAFNTLQKAAKANPDNLVVKLWLGRAARAKGDMGVAQQSFRDAAKLSPGSLEAQAGLAEISIDTHDFSTLHQVADTAIAINPQIGGPYIKQTRTSGRQSN